MRKLTAKQIDERIVMKILKRIKSFEKNYCQLYIHSACYRYVQSNPAKRKALKEIEEAEIKKLKGGSDDKNKNVSK